MEDELEVPRVGPRIPTEDTGPVILQEMLITLAGAMAGGVGRREWIQKIQKR